MASSRSRLPLYVLGLAVFPPRRLTAVNARGAPLGYARHSEVISLQGDGLPGDGTIQSDGAFLDTSALTGEPLPQRMATGSEALSGATNAGEPFDMLATHRAEDSTYAGMVRLVEAMQRSKAPMARLADRWSLGFPLVAVPITLAAWWTTWASVRPVAVLVIATPCPLILAVPVALVAGLSRTAHYGVLVRGANLLEAMARTQTLVLEKTGTLTDGRPRITGIENAGPLTGDKVLRLAASLDQVSKHPVPEAVVDAAKSRGLALATPTEGHEVPGEGVAGTVEERNVRVGGFEYVHAALKAPGALPQDRPATAVVAGIDLSGIGMIAAALEYLEPVEGALLQELIDVAVILNAPCALRRRARRGHPPGGASGVLRQSDQSQKSCPD